MGIFIKDEVKKLIKATENNHIETVKVILENTTTNKKKLNFKVKDNEEWCPILWASYYHNIELIQLFIDYANKSNTILELNKKRKKWKLSTFMGLLLR